MSPSRPSRSTTRSASAGRFRAHLQLAGMGHPELFEDSDER
ncbi:hypothetical protein [Sorangium sp. So ce1335]